jgi:hypothetical protein
VGPGEEKEAMTTPKWLNVFGLALSLCGVFLLFLFGIPFRIATGGKALAIATSVVNQEVARTDLCYTVLGWTGLGCIVLGTAPQIIATVRQPTQSGKEKA